jgi:hypothetical protein
MRATCLTNLIIPNSIIPVAFREEYKSRSSPLCSFLHFHLTPPLLGPILLLSTLFSNIQSLHSSLNVNDHVSHSYKTTSPSCRHVI